MALEVTLKDTLEPMSTDGVMRGPWGMITDQVV